MRKLLKVAAGIVLVLVVLGVVGWTVAVPAMVKHIVGFQLWRGNHVRESGYVDRDPAGTRVFWEEYGKADGPPVVVLHGAFATIGTMGAQIRPLAEVARVLAIESRGHGKSSNTAPALTYELMSDDVIVWSDARLKARRWRRMYHHELSHSSLGARPGGAGGAGPAPGKKSSLVNLTLMNGMLRGLILNGSAINTAPPTPTTPKMSSATERFKVWSGGEAMISASGAPAGRSVTMMLRARGSYSALVSKPPGD